MANKPFKKLRFSSTGDTYSPVDETARNSIGNLSELETENKSNLVEAINEAAQSGGSGLTPAVKAALLQLAEKVAYIDDGGEDYYQDLYDALYPSGTMFSVTNSLTGCANSNMTESIAEGSSYSGTITADSGYTITGASVSITMGGSDITATAYNNGVISIASVTGNIVITITAVAITLTSITAVFTQGQTVVYDTDSLDSLKSMLVVTANYSDSTTETVPSADYTLSGTLTEGTSVITVSYGGQSTTFNVTVTHRSATLTSISAVFTQGSTVVYDTDSLDSLKPMLVVTATYSDSTTQTVPSADYTLSGTLTAGTSVITVSYGGQTTTFNVTVTHYSPTIQYLYNWDFTQSLEDSVQGTTLTLSGGASRDSAGLHFTSANDYVVLPGLNVTGNCFEIDVATYDKQGTGHGRLFTIYQSGVASAGFIYNKNTSVWGVYSKASSAWADSTLGATDLNGKTVTIKMLNNVDNKRWMYVFVDDVALVNASMNATSTTNAYLGSNNGQVAYNMTITGLRVYKEV